MMGFTMRGVLGQFDAVGIDDVIKGGPSRSGIEFRRRSKEMLTAGDAAVSPVLFIFVVLVRIGPMKY